MRKKDDGSRESIGTKINTADMVMKTKERVPLGTRQVLTSEQREGFHRRWVNDVDTRIQQYLNAGYTPVEGESDTSVDRAQDPSKEGSALVRKHVGNGVYAVLMEVPLEIYNADKAVLHKEIDETEELIDPTKKGEAYASRFEKLDTRKT
jgi:hypothetical protein